MVKTHAEKIREAVNELGLSSPREIMDWIKEHYPDDTVIPTSYRADIISCSINHTSRHHYPRKNRFLWFDDNTKRYRLATPAELEKYNQDPISPDESDETQTGKIVNGIPISELSVTGQVQIPKIIRDALGFTPGDTLGFVINDDGVLEVRKAKIRLVLE